MHSYLTRVDGRDLHRAVGFFINQLKELVKLVLHSIVRLQQ